MNAHPSREQPDYFDRLAMVALFFLIAIGANERVIYFVDPLLGLILNSTLLIIWVLYTAATWDRPLYKYLLSLSLVPLLRLVSLALPLHSLPIVYWYVLLSVPMSVAAVLMFKRLGFTWHDVGINRRSLPLQLVIGLIGMPVGYVHYYILKPAPLIDHFSIAQLVLPAVILMAIIGCGEELIFRGVIQQAVLRMLGNWGWPYVAVLYAMLSWGEQSPLHTLYVFGISLLFGGLAAHTKSIIGVSLAHGLASIMLFLVMPFTSGGIL